MALENKLGLTSSADLAREEERISKKKALELFENGILDPAKVTRSALQNATSVASTLLTTESVVADIKEDAPAVPAGNPGMGMM